MNSTALVPVFAGTLAGQSTQLCNARDLHAFLGVGRDFTSWVKGRIQRYGFVAGTDYLLTKTGEQLPSGTKYATDYHLSLDTAKELAMVERTAKGREVRRYFIECERRTQSAAPIALPAPPTLTARTGCLTIEQQDAIKALVKSRIETQPRDKQGAAAIKLWSSIKSKFGVGYKEVSEQHFGEVLSLVARIELGAPQIAAPINALTEEDRAAYHHMIARLKAGDYFPARTAKQLANTLLNLVALDTTGTSKASRFLRVHGWLATTH